MTKHHSKKSKKRKIRSRIPPRPIHPKPQVVPEVQPQPEPKAQFPKNTRSITESTSPALRQGYVRRVKLRGASSLKSVKASVARFWHRQKARARKAHETIFWVLVGLACMLLVLVVFQAHSLWTHSQEREQKEQGRAELMRQQRYWMGVVTKYQDYRDGYYNIALLAYKLGEDSRAEEYIQKALELDPNFKQGKELEAIIEGKK